MEILRRRFFGFMLAYCALWLTVGFIARNEVLNVVLILGFWIMCALSITISEAKPQVRHWLSGRWRD